ncbi:MAG: SGNH/GDSL hydrolase family protein [Thermoactinospora sp.]|nr:SGNH/GDSL hydrolase family protein [Thermoactinospora sp.]
MRGLVSRRSQGPAAALVTICALISGCTYAIGESAADPVPTPVMQKAAPVMMVVGDSFTVGSGPVPAWGSYASETARLLRWQPVLAGAGGTGYVNRGRVGRNFQESFEAELAWRPAPDLVILSGGHNDRRWATLKVRQAASSLLWAVRGRWPETRIVMVGPLWMGKPPPKAFAVRDALAEVAEREGVHFVDPMRRRWTGHVLPDGVHPTAAGHRELARWLAQELKS